MKIRKLFKELIFANNQKAGQQHRKYLKQPSFTNESNDAISYSHKVVKNYSKNKDLRTYYACLYDILHIKSTCNSV